MKLTLCITHISLLPHKPRTPPGISSVLQGHFCSRRDGTSLPAAMHQLINSSSHAAVKDRPTGT